MRADSSRIVCRKRFKVVDTFVFGCFGLMLLVLSLITFLIPSALDVAIQKSLPSWWLLFIVGLLLYWVSAPDIVVSETGVEVSILTRIILLNWDQITRVKKYKYYAVFEVEKLTPLSRIVGLVIAHRFKPSFSISGVSHTHYSEAMEFVKNRLGSRFVADAR
ncbi:MAG: hypothetical protein GC204_14370 [Chloroflexi bacterium]|nr:hypothetical protein [Chloroflexota bacterium]